MAELAWFVAVAAALWLWADSMRARERALEAGRNACRRYGLQLLDETVAIAGLRLARNRDGRLVLERRYVFEFSETGNNRRNGVLVMIGGELRDIQLEPYTLQ
ncbi:MAG TPA: DUF3301 domain-containing protein [Burkholderiales bacterium]|nr:DUF3301 domain-containing protein [Burkholderiales bacterium]